MGNILGNHIVLKKICSYFSLEELVYLSCLCKQTRDIAFHATYANFINKQKNPKKFFQYLIKNHRKFSSLNMFDFGPKDANFHYNYIDLITNVIYLFEIQGLQIYNVVELLDYIEPEKFKCLITFTLSHLVEQKLSNYTNLESLVINDSINNNFSYLENFKNLQNLILNNTRIHGYFIFPNFGNFTFLRNLGLTNFSVITNGDIQRIFSFCTNLIFLNLTNSRIILVNKVKKYPKNNLKKLVLDSPYVFDQTVKCFNNSIKLEKLTLTGTYVTLSGVMNLINNSGNLTYLDISLTLINDKNLNCICTKLKWLKVLHISKCINIEKFYVITKLRHLELLFCQANFIQNGEIISIIKARNKLKLINISNCNFLTNTFLKKLTNKYLKNPPKIISEPNGMSISTIFVDKYNNYHFGN